MSTLFQTSNKQSMTYLPVKEKKHDCCWNNANKRSRQKHWIFCSELSAEERKACGRCHLFNGVEIDQRAQQVVPVKHKVYNDEHAHWPLYQRQVDSEQNRCDGTAIHSRGFVQFMRDGQHMLAQEEDCECTARQMWKN